MLTSPLVLNASRTFKGVLKNTLVLFIFWNCVTFKLLIIPREIKVMACYTTNSTSDKVGGIIVTLDK